jgi:hypothetical protein
MSREDFSGSLKGALSLDSWIRWAGIFSFAAAILVCNERSRAQSLPAQNATQAAYEQSAAAVQSTVSPSTGPGLRLIRFQGHALDEAGRPLAGGAGVTFAIYEEQSGGAPLWQETQNLTTDSDGRFSALLGASSPTGVPEELFSGGNARWLSVLAHSPGVSEQPRVLLVGVPYALRAADSDMLGGNPASAYMLANSQGTSRGSAEAGASSMGAQVRAAAPLITTSGASAGYLPIFTDSAGDLANSVLAQSGGNVGIGTTNATSQFHVYNSNFTYSPMLFLEGSNPGFVQTVERPGGGVAFTTMSANALNTSTGLSALFGQAGVFGNLNSGSTPPSAGFMYFGADPATSYQFNTLRLYPGQITNFQGSVGIGTTTPSTPLQVSGPQLATFTGGARGLLSLSNPYSGGSYEGIDFTYTGNNLPVARIGSLISSAGAYLQFGTSNDYSSGVTNSAMTIDYNGKVGIGTAAPDQVLTVNGSIHSTTGGFVFPDGTRMTTAASGTTTTGIGLQPDGDLLLGAGTNSGGAGNLDLQTTSAANAMSDRLLIAGKPKAMSGAVPTANLFSVHIPAGDAAGGKVKFTIVASDGTHYAMETGEIIFLANPNQLSCAVVVSLVAAPNYGGPPIYTNTALGLPPIGQSGSLNAQCMNSSFGGDPGMVIFDTAPTSFVATTHKVYYTIENQSQAAITLQN